MNGSQSEKGLQYLARSILLRKTRHSRLIILSVFFPQFMYFTRIHSWEVDAPFLEVDYLDICDYIADVDI